MSRYILDPQARALLDILSGYSKAAEDVFRKQFEEIRYQDELLDWRERLELTVDFNEDPPARARCYILH